MTIIFRLLAKAALVALLISALGTPALRADTPLRIATTPNDSGGEAYYGTDMGFFKQAGLDVTVTTMTNGGLIASGVSSGSFDIAQASLSSLVAAHQRGVPFVMIAPGAMYSSSSHTTALVVAKTSPYHSAKDLIGKTISVNGLHNVAQVGVMAWLDRNGGDSKSVKFIELPDSEVLAALAQGRIDAGNMSEPSLHGASDADTRVLGWSFDGIANKFVISGWFCTVAFAQQNPKVVAAFQQGLLATARWANTHHPQSAAILAKYTKMDTSAAMARVEYGEGLVPELVQPLVDASIKYNSPGAAMPATDLFSAPK